MPENDGHSANSLFLLRLATRHANRTSVGNLIGINGLDLRPEGPSATNNFGFADISHIYLFVSSDTALDRRSISLGRPDHRRQENLLISPALDINGVLLSLDPMGCNMRYGMSWLCSPSTSRVSADTHS